MNSRFSLMASVSAVLLLAGCSSSVTRNIPPSTGAAPNVTGVGQQTNGVATNRAIDVMFSTDMNPSTINTSTFLLARASDGKSIAGTVTYDLGSKSASFKPTADLDTLTAYNATITTGVADTAGDHLAANYAFSFATRNSSDHSPIAVYATNPPNGFSGVGTNIPYIQVAFTEGADPKTVNTSTFVVKDASGTAIQGAVSYDISTNIASFYPKAPLAPNTTYTVTISGVGDLADVMMTAPYVFSFTTGSTGGNLDDLVYETNQTTGQINGWIFDPTSASLTPASGLPVGTSGGGPYQLLVSGDRRFVYVVMSQVMPTVRGSNCLDYLGQVEAFSIDHANGALTLLQNVTLNGVCAEGSAAFDSTGQYLYVGEMQQYGGNGFIDVLKVDTVTGLMSMLPGSPFASSATAMPHALVVEGGYIYAADNYHSNSGILIYQRDASSGSVTFQSALNIAPQWQLAALPSGNILYSADNAGNITTFAVNAATGALTQTGTTSIGATGTAATVLEMEVDPSGHYLAVTAVGGVYLYSVDSSGGLTPVPGSPFSGSSRSAMFDSSGAYFATVTSGGTDTLTIYRLSSGTVVPVTSTTVTEVPGRVTMLTK